MKTTKIPQRTKCTLVHPETGQKVPADILRETPQTYQTSSDLLKNTAKNKKLKQRILFNCPRL